MADTNCACVHPCPFECYRRRYDFGIVDNEERNGERCECCCHDNDGEDDDHG